MFGATEEKEALKGAYDCYKAEADKLLKNGHYNKAIDLYTVALTIQPGNGLCLVNRSQCYLMLGNNAGALKDAEASLVEDKNYYKGMFQKAEALFNQGDFEMALVYYHRGHNVRPDLHNFRLGIRKAQEAIFNCVGTPDRVKLTLTGDLSFFYPSDEKKKRNKGLLCTKSVRKIQKRVRPTEKPGNERTIKEMLGDLYGDRFYLEKLLQKTDNVTTTGNNLRNLAQKGLVYLNKKKELWQQIKPVYARKYEERMALNRLKTSRVSTHDYVLHELDRIDKLMTEGDYEAAVRKSLKLLELLDAYAENQLPSKMVFMAATHSAIGSAYFELKNYAKAEEHHLLDLSIGEECYIDEAERRALDNLGRVHVGNGKMKEAIEVWERKLPMSRQPMETTWLCHELGRCYLIVGDFNTAKEYGERSLDAAIQARDDRWQLHALVLIAQAEVKSNRFSSSLVSFEKALDLAMQIRDIDAETLIRKAINDVHDKIWKRELEPHISAAGGNAATSN
ncbi:hypothetical protein BsWGS_11369 [Bradybaena similaris]